jgi:ribosome-binding factor A
LIRRALSQTLARGDVHEVDFIGQSITVGEVRMSADLRQATVYVMPLGGHGREAALEALNGARGTLRREVARQVTLKFAPDLRFALDGSFDRIEATQALFDNDRVRQDLARPADDDDAHDDSAVDEDEDAPVHDRNTEHDPEQGSDDSGDRTDRG